MNLVLFTGPECHLCDLAKDELAKLDLTGVSLTLKNIRENPEHYHLYAMRIPVLQRQDTLQELGWPFNSEDIRHFLQ